MTAESVMPGPEMLQQIALLKGLTEPECQQLMEIATTVEFQPGEIVLHQGQRGQRLWILLDGKCEVFIPATNGNVSRQLVVLATLEPFSNFGEMSFFDGAPHSASVRAQTQVRLWRIDREQFDVLLKKQSAAAQKLVLNTIGSLAGRMRRMDEWVTDLVARNQIDQRVPEWKQLREQLFDGFKV
jgi:CRP-like cAMP-binding protein